jgi:hypothetical protein
VLLQRIPGANNVRFIVEKKKSGHC